ncbi:MAG: hypothetical protein DRJ50_08990 [Actinobacteria bacterium]|nr:MAG: hypothetical protein DRJ50_08990 [Actinomycetota bacterium]
MDDHWRELVTVAMLGTDRRDPPEPVGPLADLVADTVRAAPSERMLAQVAACVAVRRAGVLPGPPVDCLVGPAPDERPLCVPAAVDRWHHITVSWPVLEDEWMLTLISNGWRLAPELVALVLRRHRRDPVRRTRAEVACGPLASWLVDQLPELAAPANQVAPSPESIGELPELPIPPGLAVLLTASGEESGRALRVGIESGQLGPSHRAVLINLLARVRPDALSDLAEALETVDQTSTGYGLAIVLADLANTRHQMLDELNPY